MFNLHFKVEHAKNKATKEAMIWEDEMNLNTELQNKEKKDIPKSFLLPLISSMVNHPGFKYKTSELKQIGIFAAEMMYNCEPFSPHPPPREGLHKNIRTLNDGNKVLTINIDVRY